MDFEFIQITPETGPAVWQVLYTFVGSRQAALPPLDEFVKVTRSFLKISGISGWLVMRNDHPAGRFSYMPVNTGMNDESAVIELEWMGKPSQSLLPGLLEILASEMDARKHKKVFILNPENSILHLIRHLPVTETNRQLFFERSLHDFAPAPLSFPEGFTFSYHEDIPESLLQKHLALMNETNRDIVREDRSLIRTQSPREWESYLEIKRKKGAAFPVVYAWKGDLMVGLSWAEAMPGNGIHQHMTGVLAAHRRKGLALSMKNMLMSELKQRFPEAIIRTDCYRSNVPMIRLNQSLGFRLTGENPQYMISRKSL